MPFRNDIFLLSLGSKCQELNLKYYFHNANIVFYLFSSENEDGTHS